MIAMEPEPNQSDGEIFCTLFRYSIPVFAPTQYKLWCVDLSTLLLDGTISSFPADKSVKIDLQLVVSREATQALLVVCCCCAMWEHCSFLAIPSVLSYDLNSNRREDCSLHFGLFSFGFLVQKETLQASMVSLVLIVEVKGHQDLGHLQPMKSFDWCDLIMQRSICSPKWLDFCSQKLG